MRRVFLLPAIILCCLAVHHPGDILAQDINAKLGNTSSAVFQVQNSDGSNLFQVRARTTSPTIIAGYSGNSVQSGVYGCVIGGGGYEGYVNSIMDHFGVIAGGANNVAGTNDGSIAAQPYATVGGGYGNTASADSSTVGGGHSNTAGYEFATVGGGYTNTASGDSSTIAGGYNNTASGRFAVIAGGYNNTANRNYAAIAGGSMNTASGVSSMIPGGYGNTASESYSFAAGVLASATHRNSFVWNDRDTDTGYSGEVHEVRFYYGGNGLNCYVNGSMSGWTCTSDRAFKEHFEEVDKVAVLKSLVAMPVQKYTMKSGDPAVRHIGPVAQDFRAAFQLGSDDKTIGSSDAVGVTMAAIQGLYKIVEEKDARLNELRAETGRLQGTISELRSEIGNLKAQRAALSLQAQKILLLEAAVEKLSRSAGLPMDARTEARD